VNDPYRTEATIHPLHPITYEPTIPRTLTLAPEIPIWHLTPHFDPPPQTGVCLITESFSIVIVEGGLKSVRRYEKLMMRYTLNPKP
jgi:hypothetical protein